MKAVKIEGLSFSYSAREQESPPALEGINLEIEKGKKVVFLGANGSGKTTLFYHLNGLHLPQRGRVEIFGTPVEKRTRREIRKKAGMVFENPDNQLISTTVYDEIAFGLRNYRWGEEQIAPKVFHILSKIRAEGLQEASPYQLSWGQKKRIAIAAVLAMEPEMLVLDEPFSGLDPQVSREVRFLLDQLNSEGKTVLAAAHDVDLAYAWADEVVLLSEGRILKQGSPEVLECEEEMIAASLQVPLLAEAFKTSPYSPRTPDRAREVIEDLLSPRDTLTRG